MCHRRRANLLIALVALISLTISACASNVFILPEQLAGNNLSGFPRVATIACFSDDGKATADLHIFGYTNWNVVYVALKDKKLAVLSSSYDKQYFISDNDGKWDPSSKGELEKNLGQEMKTIARCLQYLKP